MTESKPVQVEIYACTTLPTPEQIMTAVQSSKHSFEVRNRLKEYGRRFNRYVFTYADGSQVITELVY